MKKITVIALLLAAALGAQARNGSGKPAYKDAGRPVEERVSDLLSRMTLEEKVMQLNQYTLGRNDNANNVADPVDKIPAEIGSLIYFDTSPGLRNRLQKKAIEQSRLGIPVLFGYDVIHGFRTTYPISLAQACSWNPALVKQAAEAEGLTDETITNLTAAYVSENELDSSYSGGYLFSWKKLADSDKLQDAVKDALDENRIPYTVVKAEELDNDAENPETRVIVVLNDQSSAVRSVLEAEMSSRYPNFTYVSIEHAGAVSSADLVRNALLSLAIALALMLVYIGFRFDLYSGVAALFGLVHDVLMMLAFMTFFRSLYQVSSSFIAAILTIVGYSINNTIIIFDRIRETKKRVGMSVPNKEIVENSVRASLSRTINTTLTTLFTLVALYVLGVASIREFTFPLIVGMLAGSYSSNLLNGPVWASLMDKAEAREKQKAKA